MPSSFRPCFSVSKVLRTRLLNVFWTLLLSVIVIGVCQLFSMLFFELLPIRLDFPQGLICFFQVRVRAEIEIKNKYKQIELTKSGSISPVRTR